MSKEIGKVINVANEVMDLEIFNEREQLMIQEVVEDF